MGAPKPLVDVRYPGNWSLGAKLYPNPSLEMIYGVGRGASQLFLLHFNSLQILFMPLPLRQNILFSLSNFVFVCLVSQDWPNMWVSESCNKSLQFACLSVCQSLFTLHPGSPGSPGSLVYPIFPNWCSLWFSHGSVILWFGCGAGDE